jgi:uncharacterized pyridoxal phosphate-containing UPF0001 family protein
MQASVERIRRELEEAAGGRYPVPRLMAVTKTHTPEEILPLREMGITEIGENRVQELKGKLPEIAGAFRIHLIGRLQRNKVRQIIRDVSMIQSVDSERLLRAIDDRARMLGVVQDILIEVNIGGEDIKLPRISDSEVDQMYGFLKGLTSDAYFDSNVENIVAEETAAFFEGQKSAEDVAGVIQSRVQIYINENS